MGDRDLIERCVGGDRRAWSELFQRYDAKILRAGGPDAADLRQEVWARLVEKGALTPLAAGTHRGTSTPVARVAVRVAVDHQRRRRARPPEEPFDVEPRESSLDPEAPR
jgi:DNA-directed RNA polymerase specialized sigma24 family protein